MIRALVAATALLLLSSCDSKYVSCTITDSHDTLVSSNLDDSHIQTTRTTTVTSVCTIKSEEKPNG